MSQKKRNPRDLVIAMDILHLVIGAIIVVLAVTAFLSPETHMIFFPVIFFLASALNLISGVDGIRRAGRDIKKKNTGIGYCIFGLVLFAVGVVSAICIL